MLELRCGYKILSVRAARRLQGVSVYVRLMKESLVALIDVPIFLVAAVVLFHFMLITIDVLPVIRLVC